MAKFTSIEFVLKRKKYCYVPFGKYSFVRNICMSCKINTDKSPVAITFITTTTQKQCISKYSWKIKAVRLGRA